MIRSLPFRLTHRGLAIAAVLAASLALVGLPTIPQGTTTAMQHSQA